MLETGLLLSLFNNSAFTGAPFAQSVVPTLAARAPGSALGLELTGALAWPDPPGSAARYAVACEWGAGTSLGFVWLDDHLVCSAGPYYEKSPNSTDGATGNPLRPLRRRALAVRARALADGGALGGDDAVGVTVRVARAPSDGAPFGPFVDLAELASALAPVLPAREAARARAQAALATGWATWNRASALDLVLLPHGARARVSVCAAGNASHCFNHGLAPAPPRAARVIPETTGVRVGAHATDRSYATLELAWRLASRTIRLRVEWGATPPGDGLVAAVTLLGCDDDADADADAVACADAFALVLTADFAWRRVGTARAERFAGDGAPRLAWTARGLGDVSASVLAADDAGVIGDANVSLALGAATGGVGDAIALVVGGASVDAAIATRAAVVATLARARDAERAVGVDRFGSAELARVGEAVQAAVLWNSISTPAELGPLTPVSRGPGWDFAPTDDADFEYVIFEWDNFFASLLLQGVGAVALAHSNLVQTVRSRTARGFVPNYSAGGAKSVDRTEPPVGALVLRAMVRRARASDAAAADVAAAQALVELLADDLLDWHDWFWAARRRDGLFVLGSDDIAGYGDHDAGTMQGARFESGLDNSPLCVARTSAVASLSLTATRAQVRRRVLRQHDAHDGAL